MWRVETDFFALAIFLIMLIKERPGHRTEKDIQSKTFYLVLILSIVNVVIDIVSSVAMNDITNWWAYQILMTVYVASMPLLAAVWVAYAYVIIHKDFTPKRMNRHIFIVMIPYIIFFISALTNPFTGLYFKLSENIEYERGILFMPVGVGIIMYYSVFGLIMVLTHWKRIFPRINVFLLASFFITTGCFIWVQLANPGWLIINASYAVVYVWCDITVEEQRRARLTEELKLKNAELETAIESAKSAAKAKSEFLSRMSHDIRTPMNAIIGLTHLAQKEDDIETVRNYLAKISASSKFLLGLINDILDMSKIENGNLTLNPEPLTKKEFVISINTVIRPLMNQRNIHFICQMDEGPECILVDKLRFNQIFFNLLSNAGKFTPEGGEVSIILENLPTVDDKAGMRFYVRDNGVGMSEEFLEHIYDPFSKEHSKLSNSSKGTGLGLPIVKSLVEAMGGTISVKSKLGEGTEFTVDLYLPVTEAPVDDLAQYKPDTSLQNKKILLVEDNEINTFVAKIILEQAGCIITTAENGRIAVETFEKSQPGTFSAILMDVRMPEMDGLEATRTIRALDRADAKTIPIIAMTADAFAEEQKRTIDAGMNYHISKPINPHELYSVLAEFVNK